MLFQITGHLSGGICQLIAQGFQRQISHRCLLLQGHMDSLEAGIYRALQIMPRFQKNLGILQRLIGFFMELIQRISDGSSFLPTIVTISKQQGYQKCADAATSKTAPICTLPVKDCKSDARKERQTVPKKQKGNGTRIFQLERPEIHPEHDSGQDQTQKNYNQNCRRNIPKCDAQAEKRNTKPSEHVNGKFIRGVIRETERIILEQGKFFHHDLIRGDFLAHASSKASAEHPSATRSLRIIARVRLRLRFKTS